MAPAAAHRASAVRKRHAEHPARPRPATKPGVPANRHPADRDLGGGDREVAGNSDRDVAGNDDRHEIGKLSGKLSLPKPHFSFWTRLAGRIVKRLAKHELRRLTKHLAKRTDAAAAGVPSVASFPVAKLLDAIEGASVFEVLRPQLPIQESIDVAVPLDFAWREWSELRFLPEGVDRVTDIERDDDSLSGRIDGDEDRAWGAEVLDDRECESFAWRSTEGSDCAGLVTFHSLSERLTRIELTLDVVPRDPAESAQLLTHLADRRARSELRRFKADLELVSPDVYASDEASSPR
jgi:uncharacterized membrane protein